MPDEKPIAIAILHGIGIHTEEKDLSNVKETEERKPRDLKGVIGKIEEKFEGKKPKDALGTVLKEVRDNIKSSKENLEASLLKSARDSIEKLITEIRAEYTKQGGTRPLVFKPIYWGGELQDQKEHLWEIIRKGELSEELIRKLMIYYLGDVIAYQPLENKDCFYQKIKSKVAEGLHLLATEAGKDAPLCVIAHSLGTIIASDYFVNLQHSNSPKATPNPLEAGETLRWFYTLGSPLAMYSLRYQKLVDPEGGVEQISFGVPVKVPTWKNFYDKNDLIGYPVAHLNELYEASGVQDITVEAGNILTKWNAASHTQYWSNRQIIETIVKDIITGS